MSSRSLSGTPYARFPVTAVEISGNAELDRFTDQAHVIASGVTLKLPKRPQIGASVLVLALAGDVTLDGNGHPIDDPSVVKGGSVARVAFGIDQTWKTSGTAPSVLPAPPNGAIQFDDDGTPGGAENFGIAKTGTRPGSPYFGSDPSAVALDGDMRLPNGPDDSISWAIKQKRFGNTGVDLMLLGTYHASDGLGETWFQGTNPFADTLDEQSYDGGELWAKRSVQALLTNPTAIPGNNFPGWILLQPDPESDFVLMWITEHACFVVCEGHEQHPTESSFAGARAAAFMGRALVAPDPAQVLPTTKGIALWCEADDTLRYIKPTKDYVLVDHLWIPFTFGADADQALTDAQSVADSLRIEPGVLSAKRRITSQRIAATSRNCIVNNANVHDVDWAWKTGAAVTVPAGTRMIVGSDGTDAIQLL